MCCFALAGATLFIVPRALAQTGPATADYEIQLAVPPALRALLEENLDLFRWRGGERTSLPQLRRLVRLAPAQVRNLLATEGYFDPSVGAELTQAGQAWRVALTVAPGDATRVSTVDLKLVGAIERDPAARNERLARIRAQWGLPAGAIFRQADWDAAKRSALKGLLLDTYPAASVAQSTATIDPRGRSAALGLVIDSGPAVAFAGLTIEGLKRYPESIVRDSNTIAAGDPYAQARLLELQSRLQDSPYFADSNVSVEIDAEDQAGSDPTRQVPIHVSVTEQRSRTLSLGIGASTDTGLRSQMDYRDLNLFGRAWVLKGALKLEQKSQSLSGDIQLPRGGARYRDSLSALMERNDIEGEETRKLVLGAKRSFVEGKTETVYSLRYWSETVYPGDADRQRNSALTLSYAWTRRDVDHLLYPTRGYLVNLQADGALQSLLSTQSFVRGYGRGALFYPLGTRNQLILRGELGVVSAGTREGVPSDLLFRTGGDQTIRGYAYRSLGVQEDSAVVGGRYLGLLSAEYIRWLSDAWGAALFFDRGTATDSLHTPNVVSGYGVGARWKSPVGPLNVDLGYGHETRDVRLHFSVGFSF